MKNNKFLLALAVCVGLSPIISVSMVRAAGGKDKTASSWMPSWSSATQKAMDYWNAVKASTAAAAKSIRSALPFGLKDWSYASLTQALTVLAMGALAAGYNKETLQDALNYAIGKAGVLASAGLTAATYAATTTASAVGTVASTALTGAAAHPIITTALTGAAATVAAKQLDESKEESRGRSSSREPIAKKSRSTSRSSEEKTSTTEEPEYVHVPMYMRDDAPHVGGQNPYQQQPASRELRPIYLERNRQQPR